MPHNLRTLAHERTSIFKCKQHSLYDPRGPKHNFYCYNSNVIYYICFWSILEFFKQMSKWFKSKFSIYNIIFSTFLDNVQTVLRIFAYKVSNCVAIWQVLRFWARKNRQMAPRGVTVQHLRMQLLQWLVCDNKRKRRYQGAYASNIL